MWLTGAVSAVLRTGDGGAIPGRNTHARQTDVRKQARNDGDFRNPASLGAYQS
jgi:hypothetical protein